ncbi:PLP-dependent transferase [Actinomyces slackii]|uniref:homocysteine desulfhydrase n=1 Tax=Actinomyces slackii TaxID=52774 RepID=A0A3S4SN09_9ACTO|nr:PLP-dependent transferase [Actinomyces slackii]VEG73762.1 Cystathionine gamma-synthase/O-acetylhomoserine (thiol)-lyase [Actinomyces slackii]
MSTQIPAPRTFPVHHHPTTTPTDSLHLETVVVRAGTGTDPATGAITTPIHLSTAYGHPGLGDSTGYDYTRSANPTRDVLQDALARLEGGVAGFALASGMSALELTVLTMAPHGSRIVALQDLYGGSFRYLDVLNEEGSHEVDFVTGIEGLRLALRRPASLVIIETPTNPMMVEIDIAEAVGLARGAGARLVVDNTFCTPVFQRPLDLGADAVVHSGTKYLGGHNDVMAGVVVVADETLAEQLNYRLNTTGATLGPFDCFLLLRGMKTLALRMERHQANARAVVEFLEGSEHVTRVLYPGYSGMVSFDLAESADIGRFLQAVRVFTFAESLGGVESLVTCPAVQTHADVPQEVRASYGLTDRLLRLSVGIEHAGDLVEDLRQALEAARV